MSDGVPTGHGGIDAASGTVTEVDFWFDPACPWAWLTSRWLLEVTKVRPVRPRWHVMSLSILNEGRDLPAEYRQVMDAARGPVRVCVAAEQRHGAGVLEALYSELGRRFHNEQRSNDPSAIAEALSAAGLEPDLADAATDPRYDEQLRASHEDGMSRVGTDVGTPVISVGGASVFGPVVTPAPTGEAAGRLWDGVALVLGTDGFFELKRSRDRAPDFGD